jgi:hypothetical protein
MIFRLVFLAGLFGFYGIQTSSVLAEVPAIESLTPICGNIGKTFSISLYGSNLSKPVDLLFYRPGVKLLRFEGVDNNTVKAVLEAGSEAPLGAHPFRLRTETGISELRQFQLVQKPIVIDAGGNLSPAKAQKIPMESSVTGGLAEGEVHWFVVDLKKGTRIIAEVEGIRNGSAFFDTHLELFDPLGKSVQVSDDSPFTHQDSLLEFVALVDGAHKIALRESNLGGSDEARFILHVGSFPRPKFLYPAGGKPGSTVEFKIDGEPGSKPIVLKLPDDFEGTYPAYVQEGGKQSPTPNLIRVTRHTPVDESNTSPQNELPLACHGIISKPVEMDKFVFKAKKDQPVSIQVWAWRLGSPLEPVIDLLNSEGRTLASSDDGEDHDSQLLFNPPSDGSYELRIRDQRGQGGKGFFYRVEINADEPTLECFLPRPNRLSQTRQTVLIPRGGKVFANLGVRRGSQESTVSLQAQNLPKGVTMISQSVQPGHFLAPTLFYAGNDAPLNGTLTGFEVTDSVLGGYKGKFRQVVDLVAGTADSIYQSTTVDKLAIAVVPEVPFEVELENPRAPLFQDGKLYLKARVKRKPGFDGPVELKVPFLPPWVECLEKFEVKKGQNEIEIPLISLPEAQPSIWKLALEGSANLPSGIAYVASDFVTINMVKPMVVAEPVELIAEQGGAAKFELNLRKYGSFPEGIKAKMLELPPRVGNPEIAVSSSVDRIGFVLPVETNGPVGTHPHIVCELSMVFNGDKIVQNIARETSLRIEPKGTSSIGPDGKPLSRLEQLRRKANPEKKPGN